MSYVNMYNDLLLAESSDRDTSVIMLVLNCLWLSILLRLRDQSVLSAKKPAIFMIRTLYQRVEKSSVDLHLKKKRLNFSHIAPHLFVLVDIIMLIQCKHHACALYVGLCEPMRSALDAGFHYDPACIVNWPSTAKTAQCTKLYKN